MLKRGHILLLSTLIAGAVSAAPVIPVSAFSALDNVINPVLSPDGKHLAVTRDVKDFLFTYRMLTIYALPEMKALAAFKSSYSARPSEYLWVSNSRLVLSKAFRYVEGVNIATGELEAFDIDGGRQLYLYGPRRPISRKVPQDKCWPTAIAAPKELDGSLLLTLNGDNCPSTLLRINTIDGSRTVIAELPEKSLKFLIDEQGRPQVATKTEYGKLFLRRYDSTSKSWLPGPGDGAQDTLRPISVSADGQAIYLYQRGDTQNALLLQALDGSTVQTLAAYKDRDIDLVQWSADQSRPFAASSLLDLPTVRYLDDTLPEVQIQKALSAQFPGQYVQLLQGSRDSGRWLFRVASDRDPGSIYLYDSKEQQASLLITELEKINPDQMAPMRPIQFTARDGLRLHGYLTLPLTTSPDRKPPLIVLPHGGPHGVADIWVFNRDVQFLASRGYAVLQVNYRGSAGRGLAFMKAGFLHWADSIQDDILDGVAWVSAQGLVDNRRMCTFGTSFGAYSAMMLPIRSPGTFRCAVGNAGLYDLPLQMQNKSQNKELLERLQQFIGDDPDGWRRISPAQQATAIRVPVMLAHSREDENTPLEQALAMLAALKAAGNPPVYYEASLDGHGFIVPDNVDTFYEKLEKFLAEHLQALP
jgi:dienelactone hydrolase